MSGDTKSLQQLHPKVDVVGLLYIGRHGTTVQHVESNQCFMHCFIWLSMESFVSGCDSNNFFL
eukprot:12696430-Prorocentrum_lima.AAC.1